MVYGGSIPSPSAMLVELLKEAIEQIEADIKFFHEIWIGDDDDCEANAEQAVQTLAGIMETIQEVKQRF